MAGRIYVGTSGYVYRDWRGVLYPKGLACRDWLGCYARRFQTLELNATFYRLPPRDAVRRWRDVTPPGFVFAAKGSRFLTHMKRLKDTELGLTRYYERALLLGDKLGVVLWQLPPQMSKPEVARCLDRRGAAFCEHDLVPLPPPRLTGGFRYLRFHGPRALLRKYHGRYGARALRPFARGLARSRDRGLDAFVFFNNDWEGAALYDAQELGAQLGARPLEAALP